MSILLCSVMDVSTRLMFVSQIIMFLMQSGFGMLRRGYEFLFDILLPSKVVILWHRSRHSSMEYLPALLLVVCPPLISRYDKPLMRGRVLPIFL